MKITEELSPFGTKCFVVRDASGKRVGGASTLELAKRLIANGSFAVGA